MFGYRRPSSISSVNVTERNVNLDFQQKKGGYVEPPACRCALVLHRLSETSKKVSVLEWCGIYGMVVFCWFCCLAGVKFNNFFESVVFFA